jgi:putative DNA primase/helicase
MTRYSIDEVLAAYPPPVAAEPANDNGKARAQTHNSQPESPNLWKAWRLKALAVLDLQKVYGDLLTGNKKGDGWLECRDPDSPSGDRTPSAGVADSADNAERGSFHSFRSGDTCSVFDFLIHQGKAKDFRAAQKWIAKSTGVALPQRGGSWDKYKADGAVIQDCVPILETAFRLLRSPEGLERVFMVNGRNEATFLQVDSHMRQMLHDSLKESHGDVPPEWLLDKALRIWRLECKKIAEEPEPFCFKGDDSLCFKRFDWEPEEGTHPAWDEFLHRLSDPDAFMAFVWSCFVKTNRSRQYLWLRGDGQDGKSVVLGVLSAIFGNAATAINNSHIKSDSRFLFSSFYGKRVVVYPDCKNARFGMTEIVRNCTSGDSVLVEFKNQTPFTAVMRVKLLIGSNCRPEFTAQAADTSRIIYIEVAPTESKDDPDWHGRLVSELPQFLWACRKTYETHCPRGGDIILSERTKELTGDSVASFEEPFLDLFDTHFEVQQGARTEAGKVLAILRSQGKSNDMIAGFKSWLHQSKGVKYKNAHEGRFYVNLAIKKTAPTH